VSLISVSRDFLRAAKNGNPVDEFLIGFTATSANHIIEELSDDNAKKVFWLNLYNAFVLIEFRTKRKLNYGGKVAFFQDVSLSLDEIEHGIIRGSKNKFGLGYLRKWRVSSFEKLARVQVMDYRIHFVLNCGANSCPPIFMFSYKNLERDLDYLAEGYLMDSVCFKQQDIWLKVPRLCLWFFGDFGGFKGIKRMLKFYKILAPDEAPKIGFLNYDWSTNTNNFSIQIDV